ncbi:hypothetical protein P8452_75763 [Trifolium repens]|nr:hypothetical protein P8452_75763 [Trifolium repens]
MNSLDSSESDSSDSSGSLVSEVSLGSCSDFSRFGSNSSSRSRFGSVTLWQRVPDSINILQHGRKEEDKKGFSNPKPAHHSFSLYQFVFFWFWFMI